jgi:hypothetical protein
MCIFCNNSDEIEYYFDRNSTIIIENCENIKELPVINERIYDLTIRNCKNLYKISSILSVKLLNILYCEKLEIIDINKLNNLEEVYIERCNSLIEIPKIENNLFSLKIKECRNLYKVSLISEVKLLYILNCNKLEIVENINNLRVVNIDTCNRLETIRNLSGINYYSIDENRMIEGTFKINNCGSIRKIPYLDNFRKLYIENCNKLELIEPTKSVYDLRISDCKYIKEIPRFINLVTIHINNTPIQSIPYYENLRILHIYGNDFITNITSFPNLINLSLSFCNNLHEISTLPKLTKCIIIDCENLKYVFSIPKIHICEIRFTDNIERLQLQNTTMFYTFSTKFQIYHPFIGRQYPRDGFGLTKNMYKLIKLQQYIRKYLNYKRFTKYIKSREFNEWFYHPNSIGGKAHIKTFYNMLQKI